MRAGKYISQLSGDLEYKSFTPELLPFQINIDNEMQDMLQKAHLALGRLDGITDIVPDVDFFILMYVRKEATLSSQVEGTQATFCDLLKAEANIKDSETHKDVDEILNYIDAMNYGLDRLDSLPLSLRLIKEIHALLLKGVRGERKDPGEFRKSQNWVGGATIKLAKYIPPPAHDLMRLLDNFEKFIYNGGPTPPLIKIGLMHSQFENIHPFLDGNGRVGRILIPFYLCQQKILKRPLLYLSEFFKQHREDYYDALHYVHEKDDIEGWVKFFLEGVMVTADKAVETARKIMKLREEDTKKVAALGRSAGKGVVLLNYLYKNPIIRIKNAERAVDIKNPNAIALISKFVKAGVLKEITKRRRNKIFLYKRYVDLFD